MSILITFFYKPQRRRRIRPKIYASFRFWGYRKKNGLLKVFCAVFCVLFAVAAIDAKLRPTLKSAVGNAVKNKLSITLSDAVGNVLKESGVSYSSLVNVERDLNGSVTSITSDTLKINILKADITKKVGEMLSKNGALTVKIPLGTLLGSELFNGRGTDVKIKVDIYGFAVTDFKSSFESAGINQTRHSIYISVKASAYSHAGTVRCTKTVETDILVAETVTVGSVPNTYFSILK